MQTFSKIILAMMAGAATIAAAVALGGIGIWLLWPHVVPAILPGAVASGLISKDISFITAVMLGFLLRGTISLKN